MKKNEKDSAKRRAEAEQSTENEQKSASRSYKSVEALHRAIEGYFAKCDRDGTLYGEAGLALYLSEHSEGGRLVSVALMRKWYDGQSCAAFQTEIERAYMRIQSQIESDPRYMDKTMGTRAIFLLKQPRFGGLQDKIEAKQDISVNVNMGKNMDKSDWE